MNIKYLKAGCIEYLYWLYTLACIAWMALRLLDIGIPTGVVFGLPFAIAGILTATKSGLGSFIVSDPGADNTSKSRSSLWKAQIWLGVIFSLVMGWIIVDVKPIAFFTQAHNTQSILSGIFNPNPEQMLPMLQALVETIFLALLATVFAIPFAFVLSFGAAKNLMFTSVWGKLIYLVIRTVATVFRSIEAIVWAIIFCVWVGIGPFAGMLALWIHSIASLIKLYSEQIENIDPGPVEAIKACGASTLQVYRYAVVPQILAPYLAFTIYRWDINVRMATIVGFVGGGGIGLALYQQQQMLAWRNVGLIMWLVALTVWVMDFFSAYIRDKLLTN